MRIDCGPVIDENSGTVSMCASVCACVVCVCVRAGGSGSGGRTQQRRSRHRLRSLCSYHAHEVATLTVILVGPHLA
jgi:hypothetical protein